MTLPSIEDLIRRSLAHAELSEQCITEIESPNIELMDLPGTQVRGALHATLAEVYARLASAQTVNQASLLAAGAGQQGRMA